MTASAPASTMAFMKASLSKPLSAMTALGHADERITRRRYAHLSKSYVADTVRSAVAGLGIVEENNVVRLGVSI